MKTIEQKTKAYDEAYKRVTIRFGTNVADEIFPELAESEDERIRDALVAMVTQNVRNGYETFKGVKNSEMFAWLEKQGEQKPQGKSALEAINEEKVDNANKVESKFKPGDWIACEELNTAHIINIQDDRYEVEFIDGNKGFPHINYIDRNYHLWTIQDAKDGDVLIREDFGYASLMLLESFSNGRISLYCWYNSQTNNFHINADVALRKDVNIYPATKEQRDLLFQKMREVGYEWDGENKELKKINYFTAEYERGKADALKSVAWSEEVDLEKEIENV